MPARDRNDRRSRFAGPAGRDPERVRLIGRATLAAFVLTLGLALALLLPSARELEDLSTTAAPSELSLQHLKALATANPGDVHLRLLLARSLFATGDLEGAEDVLRDVVGSPGDVGIEARKLAMRIAVTRFRAHTAGTDEDVVDRALHVAVADALDPATLEEAAKAALEIGRPRFALELYERLAHEDLAHRSAWLAEAARWRLAVGDQTRASELYDQAAAGADDPTKRRGWALASIDAASSAGQPQLAHELAERWLKELPGDPEVLGRALRYATATGKVARAHQLGRLVVAGPDQNDPDVIAAQIDRELAAGERDVAIALLRRLVVLRPADASVHARLAELTEAAGDRTTAYAEYRWLVEHGHDGFLDRAIALARATWDSDGALALMLRRAQRTEATEKHILEVVQAYEDVGDPDAASSFLRARLGSGAGSRALWKRLAILEEQRGAPAGAVDAWRHVTKGWGIDGAEAVRYASLLWRLDKPRDALDALDFVREGAAGRDDAYWALLGDLAWELNDHPNARRAYQAMLARGDRSLETFERLATIEQADEHYARAAKYAAQAYKITGDVRMLFLAIDLDEKIGDDASSVALLSEAANGDPGLKKLETYWMRRARALQRLGELGEACRAYEEALRIAPSSVDDYSAALACAVEKDDRPAIARHVARWKEEIHGSVETYPTYALALLRLHRDREAVAYMLKHLRARPNDYMWLLELADTVERLGDYSHAYRIRRHALLKLWPHAIAALKSPRVDPAGRQALLARAILARQLEGPAESYKWLERLMPKGEGKIADAQVADLAVSYYLADGNSEMAKRVLMRSRAARPESDRNARLTIALLDNNLADVERLLTPAADGQPFDSSRIEALVRTGHDAEAINAIDAAIASSDAEIDRNTIRDLRGERADASERIAPTLRAGYKLDAYGPLFVEGPHAEGIASWGKTKLEVEAQTNQISSSAAALPLGSYAEYQAGLGTSYRTLRTNSRLALGANARAGLVAPQVTASHAHQVTDRLSLRGEAALQSVPADTPVIRAGGLRDAATLGIGVALSTRDRIELTGSAFQERTIHQDRLDTGTQSVLTVSHKLVHAPEWSVQASGLFLDRWLAAGADPALARLGIPPTSSARDLLPPLAYMASVGTRLENGDPTSPWGRSGFPRYSIALDGGRLWPLNQWTLEARASVGTRVFGDDILGASAYYSRGLAGEGSDAFRGVSIYYAHGL